MNSLWYGLAMVAILIIVHWFITNDTLTDGETKGILAMKRPQQAGAGRRKRVRARFSMKNVQ